MMSECHIGVFGAGVVGLHTCLELQRLLRNCQITVIADKFKEETTSDGAAGLFEPSTYFSGPTQQITQEWISNAYEFYKTLANVPGTGVKAISGYNLSKESYEDTRNVYLEKTVSFRRAEDDELSEISGDWKYGFYYETFLVECRYFLPWAMQKFQANGGTITHGKLSSFSDVSKFGKFDVIMNCTGLGAKELCGDEKLVPIRGQVYKVDAPWLDKFYCGGDETYIIPGISAATLGVTRNFGCWKREVDIHDSQALWERCTQIVPRLRTARVIRQWVGLRPYRPIVRVEPEIINGLKVVHNYGHGGYGVTNSPGTAQTAAKLAVDLLKSTSKY